MSSLWKDLLFLHGHLAHKEDLLWRDQAATGQAPETPCAETPIGKAVAAAGSAQKPSKERTHRWPRLAAPR